jgi:cellulose biosynthesis protein BcsQ
VAFFNNKGGVGKTSLVYHQSWMYADLGAKVLVADFDPQANLTAAFLDEERLEELWSPETGSPKTVYGAIEPIVKGVGDIVDDPHLEEVDDRITLLPGDLSLARFEDDLSQQWPICLDGKERAFRIVSAFWRLLQRSAAQADADFALVDLGPNLGAINRAGLVASDHLVVPLAPDLFSLQGLRNLGPTVRDWRKAWQERLAKVPSDAADLDLPEGSMEPAGYVVLRQAVRLDRPVKAYERWVQRVPSTYAKSVLGRPSEPGLTFTEDPECLGLLKHYHSLMPLAQEARKPIFHLKPADGAIGAHAKAAEGARQDFESLARTIAERCGLPVTLPPPAGGSD